MPSNSGKPVIMGIFFFLWGFCMVFSWWIPSIIFGAAVFIILATRSFERDHGYYVPVDEIIATENKLRGENQ